MGLLDGRRILVVEDETMIAMLLQDTLCNAGAVVLGPSYTVADALTLLDTIKPDAAVLDLNLVGRPAGPVADALGAKGVPFLVVTGYWKESGIPGHPNIPLIAKPFDPTELVAVMAGLFTGREPVGPSPAGDG